MCFTLPQKIIKTQGDKAISKGGNILDASLVPVKMGDWVICQNELIIAKITPKRAEKFFQLLDPNSKLKNQNAKLNFKF